MFPSNPPNRHNSFGPDPGQAQPQPGHPQGDVPTIHGHSPYDSYGLLNALDPDTSSQSGEKGYSWLFFSPRWRWIWGFLITILFISLSGGLYFWYRFTTSDISPFGVVGLSYAIIGTLFLLLAMLMYTLRRRLRKRAIGQLNASLNWHVFFAIMGLAAIFIHSFGNFSPISGTFALYGMIALTVSGVVGRFLDRLLPRLIAQNVSKVLTAQGEDRITTVSQRLEAIVVHNTAEELTGFAIGIPEDFGGFPPNNPPHGGTPLHVSWDLAYISLEPTQQELDRYASHYRLVPDKKSALSRPGAMMPGAQEHMSTLHDMDHAMRREQTYRYLIRYWRIFHVALAFLTIGLVIWHIIFALHIIFPTYFP